MEGQGLIGILSDPSFIDFIGTFGLGVVLVLYFVLIRDPRHTKYWQEKYDDLADSYQELSEDYKSLEARLDPEKREMSHAQALKLCHLALDRDLFKLYFRLSDKIDRSDPTAVATFIQETILDTNETWSKFKSPFPRVPNLTDLYGIYQNGGDELAQEVEATMSSDMPDKERKDAIWNHLLTNCIGMKRELNENLRRMDRGEEVKPYQEPILDTVAP